MSLSLLRNCLDQISHPETEVNHDGKNNNNNNNHNKIEQDDYKSKDGGNKPEQIRMTLEKMKKVVKKIADDGQASFRHEQDDDRVELKKENERLSQVVDATKLRSHRLAAELIGKKADCKVLTEEVDKLKEKISLLNDQLSQTQSELTRAQFQGPSKTQQESKPQTYLRMELEREIRSRMELEEMVKTQFVPKASHDQLIQEYEKKLQGSHDKMVSLDHKFKQLWQTMKDENNDIRKEAEGLRKQLVKEREARTKEEKCSKDASKKTKHLEARVRELESDTLKLRMLVKAIREQSQIIRTIARIRNETSVGSSEESMGFDRLIQTIDNVSLEVERQCSYQNQTKK